MRKIYIFKLEIANNSYGFYFYSKPINTLDELRKIISFSDHILRNNTELIINFSLTEETEINSCFVMPRLRSTYIDQFIFYLTDSNTLTPDNPDFPEYLKTLKSGIAYKGNYLLINQNDKPYIKKSKRVFKKYDLIYRWDCKTGEFKDSLKPQNIDGNIYRKIDTGLFQSYGYFYTSEFRQPDPIANLYLNEKPYPIFNVKHESQKLGITPRMINYLISGNKKKAKTKLGILKSEEK